MTAPQTPTALPAQSAPLSLHIQGVGPAVLRIGAVAGNTLREAMRARLFYGILAAAFALILGSLLLSDLALVDQKARLVQDFGLFFIPILCVATAVLMGSVLLFKEIDRKTLYAILPKPIRRSEFLLGKFAGLCALLLLELTVLGLAWLGVLTLREGQITPALFAALGLHFVELVVVTAVALFFSALSSPILAGVFTIGVFVTGRVSYIISELLAWNKGVFVEVPAMRAIGKTLVKIVPDLSTFSTADELLLGQQISTEYILAAVQYGGAWTALFLVLAIVVFERRDLV
jgi:Cu-processing system permease protein